ncbi:non-ribosomal peptide synthetase/type I polyketide synthase [Maribacter sp. 1_MG-2023]|uniref:non-ribosomal peptide synthetase/type I polyketide synthase n=1 Tax=Maribacter sp. 1_MG-2023 TaxID=3062677 RepID=UPI0026E13ED0|nr:non-ribosomal peptide synthetase/type I polyketide synthase [Maribacter sp. 1_MG-2023]MDO6470697.1 amino acid adenylation domain-containing protein [Maribacter sp. 1_MG-2023]
MEARNANLITDSTTEYWKNILLEDVKLLDLPSRKLTVKESVGQGSTLRTYFSADVTSQIKAYTAKDSIESFLITALSVLLQRYTNQLDIAFGLTIDDNDNKQNNLSLFRNTIAPTVDFNTLSNQTKKILASNKANIYPTDKFIKDFNLVKENGENAILDFVLSINSQKDQSVISKDISVTDAIEFIGTVDSNSNIKVVLHLADEQFKLDVVFNENIFDKDLIEQFMVHFKTLVSRLIEQPSTPVGNIDFLSKKERNTLLSDFNKPVVNYPKEKTIVDLLNEQAAKTPNNTAVVYGSTSLTYDELHKLSNQFADYLIKKHGASKGDFACLLLERSEWLIVSMMGIMKAGAVYVPVDPNYPVERIDYIKEDSNCDFTVDAAAIEEFKNTLDNYATEDVKNIELAPNDLIYIIYTSGTTGKPKGVQLEHRNIVSLFVNDEPFYDFNDTDVWTMFHSYCFDFSVWEMYGALLFGGKLIIPSKEVIKDPYEFMSLVIKEKVTILNQTPSSFLNIMGSLPTEDVDLNLRYVIFGGEALFPKYLEKWYRKFPSIQFVNGYGITETTIFTTFNIIDDEDIRTNISNIGNCISTLSSHVVNTNNQLQPIGVIGELCISGHGLARGYLNRPELTSQKFIDNPFEDGEKMYRSGDLVKRLADGTLEYIGRIDHQVKIRGHRVELGEIESSIDAISGIKRTVVLPNTNAEGEARLVAYLLAEGKKPEISSIKQELNDKLPEFMVPTFFMWVDEFPTNSNGKIDKEKLPEPSYVRSTSDVIFRKPRTKIEKGLASIWEKELKVSGIGLDDNFFEMGGTSIVAQKVVNAIMKTLQVRIPVTKLYQHTTISALSEFMKGHKKTALFSSKRKVKNKNQSNDVAIVGMAGRFPGVNTIDEFWDVLKNGKETISFFTKEELDQSIPASLRNDPLYVAARGVVPSAKKFDARFFGLTPKLAEAMDPQQRLFLELAWEALEESGHLPEHYTGRVGVYAGTGTNTYYKKNVLPNSEVVESIGQLQLDTVNEKDYVASRTAYQLNLKGPAVSVHSACSTSLLAIAEAVESIRNGHCEVALAGGSSITAPINSGHLYQEGSMLSTDGHCRPFDAQAKGTVFSDGAGVIVLKDLEEAKNDGDVIYGVVKGVGINNDGGGKGSFTAPSAEGQANAIKSAIDNANISPDTISYVEAHGTATPLGDPIEIDGLNLAFGEQSKNNFCGLGSVKSNMGHMTAAAGVAGVIKTILAFNHKLIPPSLGYDKPNPVIDFENSPFYVNNKLTDWNVEGPRRAGVSSFGVGGTNVHVVLEEYEMEEKTSKFQRPLQLLPISAKTETSLAGFETVLKKQIDAKPELNLADVAYSLSTTKANFNNRRFILASDTNDASEFLIDNDLKATQSSVVKNVPSEIVFLLPGQGSQYLNMGKDLYDGESAFREAVDNCADLLLDTIKVDIRKIIFQDANSEDAENKLRDTRYTQPALFTIEYALSQLWMSWGILPTVLCGHSLGEFVGAHLAGVFSLEDALKLVSMRGILVSGLPKGSMLTVRIDQESLEKILPKTLSIAAINSVKLCVVSGEDDEITKFSELLKEQSLAYRLIATSHAFHSSMMDPILEEFRDVVKNINLNIPELPIISTVTGTWLTNEEAVDAVYWTNHLRDTVRFSDAMDTIVKLEDVVLLEVGPGNTLTTLSRQNKGAKNIKSLASLPIPKNDENSYHGVLKALGQLWLTGLTIDWNALYTNQERQKLRLPTYVFDRKPCWIDPLVSIPKERTHLNADQPITRIIEKPKSAAPMRNVSILNKISELISNSYGIELEVADKDSSFLELGLDSLILTQMAITCKKEFKIPITFRQLNEGINTPELLANYLDKNLPAEFMAPQPVAEAVPQPVTAVNHVQQAIPANYNTSATNQTAIGLIGEQLNLLSRQLQLLQGNALAPAPQPVTVPKPVPAKVVNGSATLDARSEKEKLEHKKPFGASPRIEKQSTGLDQEQSQYLKDLTIKYNTKTIGSKNYAQDNRAKMADPRVVSGFKPLTKELVYPLVIGKSAGNRLWDVDGNEYIDALNGFGSCFFGYQPDFIKKAMHDQIELGYEVGPQHPLAGEVCELLCEFTGHDRAALCNTGSEAVLGAMRIARTVTGRSLIVAFTGAYHGINDEGIVRGSQKKKTFPAAAGILPEAVQNMLILDYGTDESLQIIKERAHEIAGVLIEPVQSRRPEFQPVEFIKNVRELTTKEEIAFIFDEVITGFRMHPGGAQALFDVKADLATYGKVMGGGVSIGAIVGKKEYMDALDGGFWQYGDDSYPEVGVTYFAGTFVRHPLALASSKAALLHMKEQGPSLQANVSAMTERMAKSLNATFAKDGLPIEITYFGSLWRLKFKKDIPYSELLFVSMREKGIHIWDGFPCFLTTAYTSDDVDFLMKTLLSSIDELVAVGILSKEGLNGNHVASSQSSFDKLNTPPVPGARLGRDEKGQPAWYVADASQESGYMKIDI